MSTKNFGFASPPPQPKSTKSSTKRAEAVKRYDKLRSDGTPDYEIYIRIQGKKNWYPVGAIAVKRSNLINQAIFGSQNDLLTGAFRLYPILRKHQHQLEYGYRLKEYKDEPIQLAVPPKSLINGGVSGLLNQVKTRVSSLFGSK
jgi:hypothetical protein